MTDLKQLCIDLEHFVTPEWAARAILKKELLTRIVLDPGCGGGVLSESAKDAGAGVVWSWDVRDWGYPETNVQDFLSSCFGFTPDISEKMTIFMNPPFSKACEFVEKSIELGARKIICFQRFAWWESQKRRAFWRAHPPARVYICGDRADCWRHDIPESERKSSTPTAHAWFVWDRESPPGTLLGHIYKGDAA